MDKRSGFWQVDLTRNAQELPAFITPHGMVFKLKVMPFWCCQGTRCFPTLSILRGRPVVPDVISWGAPKEAHIDFLCLGTNTLVDHVILLSDFFAVCKENHTRLK